MHLLPAALRQATGIEVKVVALGAGRALDMGRQGDADVLFVHDRVAEEKIVAEGFAVQRFAVMYNDFVLIGPRPIQPTSRAGHRASVAEAGCQQRCLCFARGQERHPCRRVALLGDDRFHRGQGQWLPGVNGLRYGAGPEHGRRTGAYVLADRGTWLSFKNRADLGVLVEGDQRLFNQYGVLLVNPARYPHVKAVEGQKFIDWVRSAAGQASIAAYKVGGEQLFFPNANAVGQ